MKNEIELEREIIYAEANHKRFKHFTLLIKQCIIRSGGKTMIERLKSPVFWTELVLLVAQALRLFGVYEMPNDMIDAIQVIITTLFSLFATLNNPKDRKNF